MNVVPKGRHLPKLSFVRIIAWNYFLSSLRLVNTTLAEFLHSPDDCTFLKLRKLLNEVSVVNSKTNINSVTLRFHFT